jgi:uncharacterized protein (TIGR02246 family)
MHILSLFLLGCIISFNSISQKANYSAQDVEALKALPIKWQNYWNSHNMDSMGTLLRDNVNFITVAGRWSRGKAEAIRHHKERHQTMFKASVWQTDSVAINYIKPDLAILYIGWGLRGDLDPDGTPRKPRSGIFTWVATKESNEWLLVSVHNVNINEVLIGNR